MISKQYSHDRASVLIMAR